MQAGSVYRVRTVAATQFAGALAQNAGAVETLDFFANPPTFKGDLMGIAAGKHCRVRVREIRIVSVQQLSWELWALATATIGTGLIGDQKMLGQWQFDSGSGLQASGDGFFYYYVGGLDLAYENLDVDASGNILQTGKMYLRLINRSVTAKIAGALGNIEVELAVELLQGR